MFPPCALLLLISFILTPVGAEPVRRNTGKKTLSFTTMMVSEHGGLSIVEKDRARIQAIIEAGKGESCNTYPVNATSFLGQAYTAEVGIGNPPTYYKLLIDTGSSNTWVGADKPYVRTEASQNTGHSVSVSYGSSNFSGEEWNDTLTLNRDLIIRRQSIGVASSSYGFSDYGLDGILGLGPTDLTETTVNGVFEVPTVLDNLLSQGTIMEEVLGVYFIPATGQTKQGELTFGGYDESATTTPMVYVPLAETRAPLQAWGIKQSISYGDETILSSAAGIVDTATTFIYIATHAYNQYQEKTGATFDSTTGLLMITPDQYKKLKPLVFYIGGTPFPLTPNAQIWPRSLNHIINGKPDAIYLVVGDQGSPPESHVDFINGFTFLERFYSIYDTSNKRVGFAATKYTWSESN